LITGVGKSGSTALYYLILNALPSETVTLFEPENSKLILSENTPSPALVKSFIPYSDNFSFFEKKILLVRDPRDNLISLLLYKPYNIIGKFFPGEKEKAVQLIRSFIDDIERKESGQHNISVFSLAEKLDVSPEKRMGLIIDYLHRNPDVFVMKYEDLIDKNLMPLEDYLNVKLNGNLEIPSKFQRVVRSKKYDNWRSWFTPEDIDYYKPLMSRFMEIFGYKCEWELEHKPKLDPEIGSLYIRKIIKEAEEIRAKRKLD